MNINVQITSLYETNTYILITSSKNAIIIDPAEIQLSIIENLLKDGITVKKILLTHGHFDHTKACAEIVGATKAKVYIHAADSDKLSDVDLAMGSRLAKIGFIPIYEYETVSDGEKIVQDELEFTVLHTPGHTAGSVVYQLLKDTSAENILFTGDTLFKETIGATHDRTSDIKELFKSVERLKGLDKDFRILPGHGEETTLFYEKKNNPYMISTNWL